MPPNLPERVSVQHHPALPSTSSEAMRLVATGEAGPVWVVTDDQTAGRGRSGRIWESIPGNLYASLLVRLGCSVTTAQQLSLVAGVAVVDAIGAVARDQGLTAPADLRLKWPNDVLVGDAKIGGILVETTGTGAPARAGVPDLAAVIGIGLNIAGAPDGLGRNATHLAAHGLSMGPDTMLRALAWSLDTWLGTWAEGAGLDTIRRAWLERGLPIGAAIHINTGDGQGRGGTFAGLDADGALLLRRSTETVERYAWGDVAIGPAPAMGAE